MFCTTSHSLSHTHTHTHTCFACRVCPRAECVDARSLTIMHVVFCRCQAEVMDTRRPTVADTQARLAQWAEAATAAEVAMAAAVVAQARLCPFARRPRCVVDYLYHMTLISPIFCTLVHVICAKTVLTKTLHLLHTPFFFQEEKRARKNRPFVDISNVPKDQPTGDATIDGWRQKHEIVCSNNVSFPTT